jgi:Flp pilus assembly protein TadG
MNIKTAVRELVRRARSFVSDQRGNAMIEFVVITPIMLAVAYGSSELSNAIAIDRKVTSTARTVSDIVAQYAAIPDADMLNVLNSGKVLMQPYQTTTLKIRVSAVSIDATKKATVTWSDALPASEKRGPGDVTATIPPGLLVANTQLIWGEVAYDYTPNSPFGAIKALWQFKYPDNQFFARPREASGKVCRPTC